MSILPGLYRMFCCRLAGTTTTEAPRANPAGHCTVCSAHAGWPAQLLRRHCVPILLGIVQYVLLQAGRHSYYGGTACQSCRAFFRRSVQSRGHTHFSCRDQQDCPLDYRYSSILQYTKNCCTQCTLYSYSLQLRIMLEFMQALKTATVSHPNLKHQNKF